MNGQWCFEFSVWDVAERLLSPDFVRRIPAVFGRDPREIRPGQLVIGPARLAPMPADRPLLPRPTGLERAGR